MSWEEELKGMIGRLGRKTYLSIFNNKGMIQLRYRPPAGKVIAKNIPFKWNKNEMENAYIRIRNIYKWMDQ